MRLWGAFFAGALTCGIGMWSWSRPHNEALLSRAVEEPAGEHCRYGGQDMLVGLDANGDGTLEPAEATTHFYLCAGGIEGIARNTFGHYVHSVGIVVAHYENCPLKIASKSGGVRPAERALENRVLGTGWLIAPDLVVTNAHVVDTTLDSGDCDDGKAKNATKSTGKLRLRELKVYFPKLTADAPGLLHCGLKHYSGKIPSLADFDAVDVSAVDRSAASLPPESEDVNRAVADLAFLRIPQQQRAVLPLSDVSPGDNAGDSLQVSDEVFHIGYDDGTGPRLALGRVFQIQTCEDLTRSLSEGDYRPSDCNSQLGVSRDSYLISMYGYGDQGGSGSPLFDRFGRVVGIHTFIQGEDETQHLIAVSGSEIRRYYALPRSWQTISGMPFP